jgi:hypothetical protein
MKTAFSRLTLCCRVMVLACLACWLAGCATARVDWNARIGHYTYDQAVGEMGPPDKEAKLADGGIVAEWLIYRGTTYVYGTPGTYGPYYAGPATAQTGPSRYLRLTFGPDRQLTAWTRAYR